MSGMDTEETTPQQEPPRPAPSAGVDAVVVALALAFLASLAILGPRGPGRALELVVVGVFAVVSNRIGWRAARAAAGGATAVFLVLELHYGRLGGAHLARELIAAVLVFAVCLASARARGELERRQSALVGARDELERIRATEVLEQKLGGARRASVLEYELERSRRHNHEVSLLLVRPDAFDELTLRFGDAAAAQTLSAVAEAIGVNLRATDVPLRLGAFDFGVILPETPSETARVVGERIRLVVSGRRLSLDDGDEIDVSVAIGVSTFPHDATSNEDLIAAAQRALNSAADRGGNRTVLTSAPHDAPPGWSVTAG
jgi:diguanylate cyclase (GGDEF)-like protein